ncbi:MAG: hypothetical protein U0587_07960 [Candidatus Binatia bacterium]
MMRVSMGGRRAIMAVVAAAFVSATAEATVSLRIGSTQGAPGSTVTFQATLESGGAQVGGVQNVIAFDPATPISSCAIHPALAALSRWSLQPQGCTPLVNCTQANFVILTFGSVLADGFLYQCEAKISASAPGGLYALPCSEARASDPTGQVLAVQCTDGQVEVVATTPTVTPTPTPTTVPTPTVSPIPPTVTATQAPPTPAGPAMPTSWEDNDGCQIASSGGGFVWLLPAFVGIVLLCQKARRGRR